ncbi:uncharacterized protein LOC134264509 isoform X1 [Saccostrea cucullata]|uniref:uncharacterized protein LOC134264509 isoform X1 n=1 Tax=Saccostrea cuccullata TaxID=36930 RepID=UPI002ED32929
MCKSSTNVQCCIMQSILVIVFCFLCFIYFCTAACLTYPPPQLGHGTHTSKHHCNLNGVGLAAGETYTNTTSCLKCECEENHYVSCCSMTSSYVLPEGCVVITKDCVQEIVHESDGSQCQPLMAIGK